MSDSTPSRRRVVAAAAGALLGATAGCAGGSGGGSTATDDDPATTATDDGSDLDLREANVVDVAVELDGEPRTVSFKADGKPPKYYDQIAWFKENSRFALGMDFLSAGGVNFKDRLFKAEPDLSAQSMSWRVSDHLPLWCEFAVRG